LAQAILAQAILAQVGNHFGSSVFQPLAPLWQLSLPFCSCREGPRPCPVPALIPLPNLPGDEAQLRLLQKFREEILQCGFLSPQDSNKLSLASRCARHIC
jgi:hypothetical protein